MNHSLFDLHCDTPYEMLRCGQSLTRNSLAVSLEKAAIFKHYVQIMAHWTNHRLSDEEGWDTLRAMHGNLLADPAVRDGRVQIATAYPQELPDRPRLLLALEDARVLAGKPERVDILFDMGFRILTPLWAGNTCIGGSHNTSDGLTAFGRAALCRALELGMLLDISHASVPSAAEICALSQEYERPYLATHSNAYKLCPVSRNLRQEQIMALIASKGLIGLNLYQGFINASGSASYVDLIPHIEYFLELGASDCLCIGGDMDGCDLPPDLTDIAMLPRLGEALLQRNYSEDLVHKLFFANAHAFAARHLRT